MPTARSSKSNRDWKACMDTIPNWYKWKTWSYDEGFKHPWWFSCCHNNVRAQHVHELTTFVVATKLEE